MQLRFCLIKFLSNFVFCRSASFISSSKGKTVEIPKLGFGDPTSVKLIGDVSWRKEGIALGHWASNEVPKKQQITSTAYSKENIRKPLKTFEIRTCAFFFAVIFEVVTVTESCGAIRHGAECFNFYFPQVSLSSIRWESTNNPEACRCFMFDFEWACLKVSTKNTQHKTNDMFIYFHYDQHIVWVVTQPISWQTRSWMRSLWWSGMAIQTHLGRSWKSLTSEPFWRPIVVSFVVFEIDRW